MADLVKVELEDGSTVYFESADGGLVCPRGRGEPEVVDAGKLGDRLQQIAKAAGEVANSMRSTLAADGMQLQFGVKVTGEAGVWCFSRVSGEGSISVTLTWKSSPSP